jgi:exportin-2 (importin alpha re-exporter)
MGDIGPQDTARVVDTILNTCSADGPTRARATAAMMELIQQVDRQRGLAPLLLRIATNTSEFPPVTCQLAATTFKKVVKDCWHQTQSEHAVLEDDRGVIRAQLFGAVIHSPKEVRRVLSHAVEIICATDFPARYPNILDEMVSVLSRAGQDQAALHDPAFCDILEATLTIAHGVFAKYRGLFELTEQTKDELLTINAATAEPLVAILEQAGALAASAIQSGQLDTAKAYIGIFTIATEVLHDLTTCDLGAEHEKMMRRIVACLVAGIRLDCRALLGTAYAGGPLMELRSSTLEVIAHYMLHYDEEVADFASQLMQVVWDLIRDPSSATPAADDLVVSALGFFESMTTGPLRTLLESVLEQLCVDVVLPALNLSSEEIESFEDEPKEYIQRDIEGSDVHTRRHSAIKLIRALLAAYPNQCVNYFNSCIEQLAASGTWQGRDSAIVLVIAMGLKTSASTAMAAGGGSAMQSGGELTNFVDLASFYDSHISAELTASETDPNADSAAAAYVVKADALRFVATFRHHLPETALASLIPHIAQFLQVSNEVVHTYAAHTIERILSLPAASGAGFRLADEHLAPHVATVLQLLCGRLGSDRQLNEYMVRCLAQVLRSTPQSSRPYTGDVMAVLGGVLTNVAKNPSNPLFSHYLFESIGFTLALAGDDGNQCAAIEGLLWQPLFSILAEDTVELLPYALQILALLLDLHPAGSASRSPAAPTTAIPTETSSIPDHFMSLYQPLCSPQLFEHKGNVPAAVRLITSFIRKDPVQLNNAGLTAPTLELAARLLQLRLQDHYGFELIGSIMVHYPRDVLDVQLPTIFRVLFDRMQARGTPKFARLLALFCTALLARHGAVYFESLLERIQPGMTVLVLQQIVLPVVAKVTGAFERKICAVGLSQAIQDSGALLNFNNGQLWASCVLQCLSLLHLEAEHDEEAQVSASMVAPEQEASVEELRNAAVEETGVGSKFVQLVSTTRPPDDPCGNVSDARALFKASIKSIVDQRPAEAQNLLRNNLPPQAFSTLAAYF